MHGRGRGSGGILAHQFVGGPERGAETGGERDLVDPGLAVEERLRLARAPRGADQRLEIPVGEEIELPRLG